jgi:carbon storage regulator
MLVLSRKLGEKIVIDGGIVVTVVKMDRRQVRIGIEAPSDVKVFRDELLTRPDFVPASAANTDDAASPRRAD